MKKWFILFIVIGFALVGCSQKPNNEVSEVTTETHTETNADNEIKLEGTEELVFSQKQ